MSAAPVRKRNAGGAVALLLVGIASLIIGWHALSHLDRCGEHTMRRGESCPNRSPRTGHTWINDHDEQHARNQQVGVAMLAAGGGFAVGSAVVYRFTSGESRRRGPRGEPTSGSS